MKRNIQDALPGFVGLNEFFRRLTGAFVSVKASAAERMRYAQAIGQIHGFPAKWLDPVVRTFQETAKVREVRLYADDVKMIRFEVLRRTACDDAKEKYESTPINLMLALNARNEMLFYTFIYGTGRHTQGFRGWVCRQHMRPVMEINFSTFSEMMTRVDEMRPSDFVIITEVGHTDQYVQAYCDRDVGAEYWDDPLFTFEYCLRDWIWQFSTRLRVKRAPLKRLLGLYHQGGIPVLQDAVEWQQMYITAEDLKKD